MSVRKGERSGRDLGRALLREDLAALWWNFVAGSSSDRGLPGPPRLTSPGWACEPALVALPPYRLAENAPPGGPAGPPKHDPAPPQPGPDHGLSRPLGGVLHLGNFRRKRWNPAVRAAGLDGLTPHALRHTAASLAIASGANVKVVQTMLGHQSATMTLDLYGHLLTDQLDEVADAMDAARTNWMTSSHQEASVAALPTGRRIDGGSPR